MSKKLIIIMVAVATVGVLFGGLYYSATTFNYTNTLSDYGVEHPFANNGKNPNLEGYNKDLQTVLFTGYDYTVARDIQGMGYQADTLLLFVINKKTGETKIISIPRDTLTQIPILDFNDRFVYTQEEPIALSHAYGLNAGISDELTMAVVSNLLYQIPVTRYFALNIDGINIANNAIGGVFLEIMADFTMYNPQMKKGANFLLTDETAEVYIRTRQFPGMSGKDEDRVLRQHQYFSTFLATLKQKAKENPAIILDLYNKMQGYFNTNISVPELMFLAYKVLGSDSSNMEIIKLPGEYKEGVFMQDLEQTKALVKEVFFVS